MMAVLGEHSGFIIAAYGFVAVVLTVLITATLVDGARQKAKLAALEARGIRRRSDQGL